MCIGIGLQCMVSRLQKLHRHTYTLYMYIILLPVAMVLLGLLCRINKLLHCGQGAGICIGCEYQVLIG